MAARARKIFWSGRTCSAPSGPGKPVYYNGTTGYIDVLKQIDADHYQRLGRAATGAIAKTSLLVPELKRFYVAVPKHVILTPPIPESKEATIEEAKILVFEVAS
jgi:hypothetical protein